MPQGYISGHVILLLLLSAYLFISVCLKHCVLTRRQRTKLYTDTHTQHSFLFGKKEGRAQKHNASTVLLLYLSELHAGRSRSFYLPSPPAPPFQHTQGLLVFSASCISILFPMSIQTHLYANTHTYFLNYVLIMLYTLVSKLKVLSFVERSGERDSSLCFQHASTSVFLFPFWCFFLLVIFWPYCMACRIVVPGPGIELMPLHWQFSILTTGLLGKSLTCFFCLYVSGGNWLHHILCVHICLWVNTP